MVSSMQLITVVVILSCYILLSEGQTGQSSHNETLDEFQKRCQREIKKKLVEEIFPRMFTQMFTNTMKDAGWMILPSLNGSYTETGQTGKLSLEDGLFHADVTLKNGFLKEQSQFAYSFKIPAVHCNYSYIFEQANFGYTSGHVYIHILDLVFSLSSSTQINNGSCTISSPTIEMIANPKNYLVEFRQNPALCPLASNVTEEMINTFVGTHLTPIEDTLRTTMIPLMMKAWPKALKEAKPPFMSPEPQNSESFLCYAISNMVKSPTNQTLHDRQCPDF